MFSNLYLQNLYHNLKKKTQFLGSYSAPRADMDIFSSTLFDIMDTVNKEHKHCVIMGDMNIDLLKFEAHLKIT